jgi:hypothetical protein
LHEETNSHHEETDDFNETIEHCLIKFKETSNQVKPPEPTIKKKEKPPPFNYVLLNNVAQVKKFNKPAVDSFPDDVDDADDADDENEGVNYDYNDDDVEYQYDDYDGVDEDCSKHRAKSIDNIASNSNSSGTIPLATPSSSISRTFNEETPLQKISKIAVPARSVAGSRRWTRPNKRKIILPKGSNCSTSIASSDLETNNINETSQGGECQDSNPIEVRRSNRKSIPTEKFASYKESIDVIEILDDNYRVPKSARCASIAQESADRQRRRLAQAELDAFIIYNTCIIAIIIEFV